MQQDDRKLTIPVDIPENLCLSTSTFMVADKYSLQFVASMHQKEIGQQDGRETRSAMNYT